MAGEFHPAEKYGHDAPNGDFIVEEVQVITFTSGDFHFGYRNIPMGRLGNITDVEVWEGSRQYEPGDGDDYTFSTSVDGGDLVINWYPDRSFPVYSSTVTVELPEGATADPVAAYGVEAAIVGQGSRTVVFTAQETLDPGQEFEVRVQFPSGIVGGGQG